MSETSKTNETAQLGIGGVSNRTCKNCGHRNGGMEFGQCMLSGFYCSTERKIPTVCGINFERWIERPKRKGLIKWLQSVLYGC